MHAQRLSTNATSALMVDSAGSASSVVVPPYASTVAYVASASSAAVPPYANMVSYVSAVKFVTLLAVFVRMN